MYRFSIFSSSLFQLGVSRDQLIPRSPFVIALLARSAFLFIFCHHRVLATQRASYEFRGLAANCWCGGSQLSAQRSPVHGKARTQGGCGTGTRRSTSKLIGQRDLSMDIMPFLIDNLDSGLAHHFDSHKITSEITILIRKPLIAQLYCHLSAALVLVLGQTYMRLPFVQMAQVEITASASMLAPCLD